MINIVQMYLLISPRSAAPPADSLLSGIANDELDFEMAMTDEDKQLYTNAKASKTWRALRIASRNKLKRFDEVQDGNNLKTLFESVDDAKLGGPTPNGDHASSNEEPREGKENIEVASVTTQESNEGKENLEAPNVVLTDPSAVSVDLPTEAAEAVIK